MSTEPILHDDPPELLADLKRSVDAINEQAGMERLLRDVLNAPPACHNCGEYVQRDTLSTIESLRYLRDMLGRDAAGTDFPALAGRLSFRVNEAHDVLDRIIRRWES